MRHAVIVDLVRTPVGRGRSSGALAGVHPVSLLGQTFTALLSRTGIDPGTVEDIIVGCVTQGGEQSNIPGRHAWLGQGLPEHVPSVTIDRKCGSGQQAVDFAVQAVRSGAYETVIAAGVESMSRVPMGSSRAGADSVGPQVSQRFPTLVPQGIAADLIARRWGLSRHQLDEYAARSHQRAADTARDGGFVEEICPVRTPEGIVSADETIRPDTTVERLAGLPPAFATVPLPTALGELDHTITAGNSSQLADGASAVLVMEQERARALGLRPRARVLASAVCGDDPVLMLTGVIPATERVLERCGLTLSELDAVEVNEAFASVPLAWQAQFGLALDKLNPRGGAIALGHPLGASGGRLLATLVNHLEQTGGRYGLQTMCEAGGMANAMVIEALR